MQVAREMHDFQQQYQQTNSYVFTSFLSFKMISFVLLLLASEPSVNFNISKMVYSGFLRYRLSQSPFPVSAAQVVTDVARFLSSVPRVFSAHAVNQCKVYLRRCVCGYFLQNNLYNKTIITFGFCDILNNQGLGECYQPRPSSQLITFTSTLIIPDITKTSSNNCL